MITVPIVLAKEFNRQACKTKNSGEKAYHNKVFMPGVIFAIRRKEVAINYCREFMKNNSSFSCILVEDTNDIQVWYVKLSRQLQPKAPTKLNQNHTNVAAKNVTRTLLNSQHLPLDRVFVSRCQQIVAEAIGPIAKVIIKKTIAQDVKSNRQQFIARLIRELRQSKQTQDLEQQLKKLLDE